MILSQHPWNKLPQNSTRALTLIIVLISFIMVCGSSGADPYWVFFNREQTREVDDPVPCWMIEAVRDTGAQVRVASRYFYAVSVDWDDEPHILESLPCVDRVQPVMSMERVPRDEYEKLVMRKDAGVFSRSSHELHYGVSGDQLSLLNIPELHDMGLTGSGVTIGILDTGFDIGETGCLAHVAVTHTKNFVTGKADVTGDDHGSHVLSCLGGASEGEYYGVAFDASFLLAVTDDLYTERRADEDRWVAGVEWCDSLGADIISSSLVYNIFDTEDESYSKDEMDGRTSLVARAAEIAVSRGIVVVNAAGNEGNNLWGIITTPGDSEHVLAVGAVSYSGEQPVISGFSSRGPTADGRIKPDVVAPGSPVWLPRIGTADQFIVKTGTSFAAPFVSGICALIIQEHPDWTPYQVMDAVKLTAGDLGVSGPDNEYGWGLPDAVNAVHYGPTGIERSTDAYRSFMNRHHDDNTKGRHAFALKAPYPNPFNSSVNITFITHAEEYVSITIHDLLGRKISTVWSNTASPGEKHVLWNGNGFSSGLYYIKAITAHKTSTQKILLIK
ncbi:S8/S53 family peptidase [Candidatus Omnitrophota bacterium]